MFLYFLRQFCKNKWRQIADEDKQILVQKTIQKLSEFKLKVSLTHPNPKFLINLTTPYFSIVAREALEEDFFTWKAAPLGAGDYRVTDFNPSNQTLSLQAVENRQLEHPKINLIWGALKGPKSIDVSLVPIKSEFFSNEFSKNVIFHL